MFFVRKCSKAVEIQLRLKSEQRTSCAARQRLAQLCVEHGQRPGHEDQQPPVQSPCDPQSKAVQSKLMFAFLEEGRGKLALHPIRDHLITSHQLGGHGVEHARATLDAAERQGVVLPILEFNVSYG